MAPPAPALRSFNLALIQLGRIGPDKAKNIAHAREQVIKAAYRADGIKPQLIVLPVGLTIFGSDGNTELYGWVTTGMFQFPLWGRSLPRVRGDYRIQAREIL